MLTWIVWFAIILYSCTARCSCSERECPGTTEYLDGLNIGEFAGCTHVLGNVVLNQKSLEGDTIAGIPPISLVDLSHLSNIHEISGYLVIQNLNHSNLTDLRFLYDLAVIHGLETIELRPGHNYSLIIEDNQFLQTLNLASLQEIVNGGVRISNNPQLCLVDTITVEDYLVNSDLSRVGGLALDCESRDVRCHAECVETRGCWGTLPDECVECRNYVYQETCVPQCNMSTSYANETTLECIPFWNGNPSTTFIRDSSPAMRYPASSVLQPSTVQVSHHSVMTTQVTSSSTGATHIVSSHMNSTGHVTMMMTHTPTRSSTSEYVQTSLNTLVSSNASLTDTNPVTTSNDERLADLSTTVLQTEAPNDLLADTNTNSDISTWIVAVCVVVGTILIAIAIILIVVVPCMYHSKKSKTVLVQRGKGSPRKYSEDPELVQLLKVTQNEVSPRPPRQRITVGSLAQDNLLESRGDHVTSTSKSHGSHVTLEGNHVTHQPQKWLTSAKNNSTTHRSQVHVTTSLTPSKGLTPLPNTSPAHTLITPTQCPPHTSSSPPPIFHKHTTNDTPHRGYGHRSPHHHGYRPVGSLQQRPFGTGIYSTRVKQPMPTPCPHRGSSVTPGSSHTSMRPSRMSWTTSHSSNGRPMISTHASLSSLQDCPHD